jgi:cobyrinic acid a,c-diamide synthase
LINGSLEIANLYQVINREGVELGPDGFVVYNTLAGYIHFHFGSNPKMAGNFVESCKEYQEKS